MSSSSSSSAPPPSGGGGGQKQQQQQRNNSIQHGTTKSNNNNNVSGSSNTSSNSKSTSASATSRQQASSSTTTTGGGSTNSGGSSGSTSTNTNRNNPNYNSSNNNSNNNKAKSSSSSSQHHTNNQQQQLSTRSIRSGGGGCVQLFQPIPFPANPATVLDLSLLHQITTLDIAYGPTTRMKTTTTTEVEDNDEDDDYDDDDNVNPASCWHFRGKTTLYVIDHSVTNNNTITSGGSSNKPPPGSGTGSNQQQSQQQQQQSTIHQLALHLRGCCKVNDIIVECYDPTEQKLVSLNIPYPYHHADPLEHVLIKPSVSYTNNIQQQNNNDNDDDDDESDEDNDNNRKRNRNKRRRLQMGNNRKRRKRKKFHYKFDADSQSSRGAVGMTTGLRVASIASNMGELRITVEKKKKKRFLETSTTRQQQQQQQQQSSSADKTKKNESSSSSTDNINTAIQVWRRDLNHRRCSSNNNQEGNNNNSSGDDHETTNVVGGGGQVDERLRIQLMMRSDQTRKRRIDLIAKQLANASIMSVSSTSSTGSNNDSSTSPLPISTGAMKITIRYSIPMLNCSPSSSGGMIHLGGFHALNHTNPSSCSNGTPHMYTTCGTYGDHEGIRCWLPCLDSACTKHRSTYEMTIKITASMIMGLSTVGFGEDAGCKETLLHDVTSNTHNTVQELGIDHVQLINDVFYCSKKSKENGNAAYIGMDRHGDGSGLPHLIPPDKNTDNNNNNNEEGGRAGGRETSSNTTATNTSTTTTTSITSIDSILATSVWSTCTWTPIPARSIGFAIGPFKILDDREYFSMENAVAAANAEIEEAEAEKVRKEKEEKKKHKEMENNKDEEKKKEEEEGKDDDDPNNNDDDDDDIIKEIKQQIQQQYQEQDAEDDDYDDDDDDDQDNNNNNNNNNINGGGGPRATVSTLSKFIRSSKRRGEGIQMAYFAPLHERKHIHSPTNNRRSSSSKNDLYSNKTIINTSLLPDTYIYVAPLTNYQLETSKLYDVTIQYSTIGVPYRCMILMRDILALPSTTLYRTSSYIQIFIPNAVSGGITSGSLHNCPEVLNNPFLGGCIIDSRMLPPTSLSTSSTTTTSSAPGATNPASIGTTNATATTNTMPSSSTTTPIRLPQYNGGRCLQFIQARNCVRGWIIAAIPLGGVNDDVGNGYIYTLIESFIMSLYERGYGAHGEGGGDGGMFFIKRYATASGLNSSNFDFLPVQNIEEMDVVIQGVGAVPVEDRHNEQLWRSMLNGSESHTAAMDEFNIRQLLCKDAVEALERITDKGKNVPSPSTGWFGSHLSLSFLSSNASSSTDLGCGAVDMLHPIGGLVYRSLKCDLYRGVIEGRAGVANFIRLIRAAFIAAHLDDIGEKELKLPSTTTTTTNNNTSSSSTNNNSSSKQSSKNSTDDNKNNNKSTSDGQQSSSSPASTPEPPTNEGPKPPFVVCVNEILKKNGLTHTLFTRALQNLSGRIKETHLLGTLVDVERNAEDPRTRRPFVEPEGFPNSFVRGASMLYCRVGVQVEQAREGSASQAQAAALIAKGIQMQAYAEPIIPDGGVAFGGPVTVRVVENEGQFREFVKELSTDGSRRDWGATFLHAKPVTTARAQTAASGSIESTAVSKDSGGGGKAGGRSRRSTLAAPATSSAFTETNFHRGGYQAIELIRLTNLTPLLWVRVDPMGLYGGRISVFQPDACLAEELFYDGDAGAQVDSIRALAERPLRIQGSVKVTMVYDVNVSELPVRVLGDCLRGSPVLHSSLPHTPAVRAQAALAIAQWQNNKAPPTKDAVGADDWVGLNLLAHYFRERFYSNEVVMPVKFSRLAIRKSEAEIRQASASLEGGGNNSKAAYDDGYLYLDTFEDGEERAAVLEDAEEVEMEEDEEYRVRSAAITAMACIRAKDGLTPRFALHFLETILDSEDAEMVGNLVYPDEDAMIEKKLRRVKNCVAGSPEMDAFPAASSFPFVSGVVVADALLALCHVNAMPAMITDPATGKLVQSSGAHPLDRLTKAARGWLEWELYREKIRSELSQATLTGVSGNCHDTIAACATIALSNLAILKQCTTEVPPAANNKKGTSGKVMPDADPSSARFYISIFDAEPIRNDLTRAACAQAITCICCAADRIEKESVQPVGLLSSLEFLLDRIVDDRTSPGLRQTLALIMMDACSGKVCSMQRVGAIAGRNELVTSTARFLNGPLGASHGGDNGSALLVAVPAGSSGSLPAASAVNDGARRGLRLLSRAGHPKETFSPDLIVRVARFATRLWRTINGEPAEAPARPRAGKVLGVCAYDGILRSTLLAFWQLLWPRGCFSVLRDQFWDSEQGSKCYVEHGAADVMKIMEEEKTAAPAEESTLAELGRLVNVELDREIWRGEMAKKAYEFFESSKGSAPVKDVAGAEKGIGQPLPPIQRDSAFRQGGWISSASHRRRANGGTAVTKLRLAVKSSTDGGFEG